MRILGLLLLVFATWAANAQDTKFIGKVVLYNGLRSIEFSPAEVEFNETGLVIRGPTAGMTCSLSYSDLSERGARDSSKFYNLLRDGGVKVYCLGGRLLNIEFEITRPSLISVVANDAPKALNAEKVLLTSNTSSSGARLVSLVTRNEGLTTYAVWDAKKLASATDILEMASEINAGKSQLQIIEFPNGYAAFSLTDIR